MTICLGEQSEKIQDKKKWKADLIGLQNYNTFEQ